MASCLWEYNSIIIMVLVIVTHRPARVQVGLTPPPANVMQHTMLTEVSLVTIVKILALVGRYWAFGGPREGSHDGKEGLCATLGMSIVPPLCLFLPSSLLLAHRMRSSWEGWSRRRCV